MKKAISTSKAPAAVGPYSQGIASSPQQLIFVSGQLPIDPTSNQMIEGNIQALTRQVLLNIQSILLAAGSDLKHVLKTEIFLIDMTDFVAVNEVYASFFSAPFPARQTVQVAALPLKARIEISCIAVIPS